MANEHEKAQLADLVDMVKGSLAMVAHAQEERARLTATAHARGRRVTVTVNADCIVIKTEFSDDIDELTYAEIASAVTAATQEAAGKVQRRAAELLEKLEEQQKLIPTLSEVFPGMPDMAALIPKAPSAPTAPPGAREEPQPEEPAVFTETEDYEHDPHVRQRSNIAAPDW
ncbi:YbaB/EbfC family nucleoid-associated protein [Nocardia sp. NPDC057668]|uniref:YbaB/EbfC family nucleoid-associated protein n=1 Tax=Nocardia sp. NPDC057668 TaxID=3346202 RepID=UPI0036734586